VKLKLLLGVSAIAVSAAVGVGYYYPPPPNPNPVYDLPASSIVEHDAPTVKHRRAVPMPVFESASVT